MGFFDFLFNRASKRAFQPLSQITSGYFAPEPLSAITNANEALTISAFWAAIRLYQTSLASLPLVIYDAKTRKRLQNHPAYEILHDRPNPAQSRAVFMELLVKNLFLDGNFYAFIQRNGRGELTGLFPIVSAAIDQIYIDDNWNKTYRIGNELYDDSEILHLFLYSLDGYQGVPLIRYAAENLGVHKQIQTAAAAYYQNAARPANYIRYPGKLTPEAKNNIKEGFSNEFGGTRNTGKMPILEMDGELKPYSTLSAQESAILEALGNVTDVARWFGISPLLLSDLQRGTYSNVAADNVAFYQRSLRPLLEKIKLELDWKLNLKAQNAYCQFIIEDILKGDPLTQAQAYQIGINSGYLLRSEVREYSDLPEVEGLDQPVGLLNLGDLNAHQLGNPKQGDNNAPQG